MKIILAISNILIINNNFFTTITDAENFINRKLTKKEKQFKVLYINFEQNKFKNFNDIETFFKEYNNFEKVLSLISQYKNKIFIAKFITHIFDINQDYQLVFKNNTKSWSISHFNN